MPQKGQSALYLRSTLSKHSLSSMSYSTVTGEVRFRLNIPIIDLPSTQYFPCVTVISNGQPIAALLNSFRSSMLARTTFFFIINPLFLFFTETANAGKALHHSILMETQNNEQKCSVWKGKQELNLLSICCSGSASPVPCLSAEQTAENGVFRIENVSCNVFGVSIHASIFQECGILHQQHFFADDPFSILGHGLPFCHLSVGEYCFSPPTTAVLQCPLLKKAGGYFRGMNRKRGISCSIYESGC